MPPSPTCILTNIFLRYCTESCKIFTAYTTLIDGTIPSVIYCWIYRQNYFVGIFTAWIFFCVHFAVCTTISFWFFFTNRINDKIWNYRQTLCRRTFSVGELVGKKFTYEVVAKLFNVVVILKFIFNTY